MGLQIVDLNHVNVTVTPDREQATKHFYREVLRLPQIPKPVGPRQFIGAWYQIGPAQLHLSIEDNPQNDSSDRHICYRVADLAAAEADLRAAGIEIIPDPRVDGPSTRFFIRDPGNNLIEITL